MDEVRTGEGEGKEGEDAEEFDVSREGSLFSTLRSLSKEDKRRCVWTLKNSRGWTDTEWSDMDNHDEFYERWWCAGDPGTPRCGLSLSAGKIWKAQRLATSQGVNERNVQSGPVAALENELKLVSAEAAAAPEGEAISACERQESELQLFVSESSSKSEESVARPGALGTGFVAAAQNESELGGVVSCLTAFSRCWCAK